MHFFFSSRRRHTRWTGDWSSDVCSSDLGDELELDVDAAREEHVRVARRLVSDYPDVGAIVLECTNMPPYTPDIQRETGLPVFDIVALVTIVHAALGAGLGPRPVASVPPSFR